MPASRNLTYLRSRCRELADSDATTAFVDNTELDRSINSALRRLYDLLIESRGQGYYERRATITTASGQADYVLPDDFYALLGVVVQDGTTYHDMGTWEQHELAAALRRQAVGGVTAAHLRYRLGQGNVLEVRPQPSDTYTLHVSYIPTMPEIVEATDDIYDGVNGWEEWACLTVAVGILDKEESDSGPRRMERAAIEAQIRALAPQRDAGNPVRIQRTRRDRRRGYGLRNDWDREP